MSFTDYEEGIEFDTDDPDFDNNNFRNINIMTPLGPGGSPTLRKLELEVVHSVSGRMSVASVRPVGGLVNRSQSFNSVSSLDEISTGSYLTPETTVLSIEELRLQLNSCFTCGVSWQEDHVSLDCAECGGYSLERPCPLCDGHCSAVWKRDLTMSHACGKARWEGTCALRSAGAQSETPTRLLLKPLTSDEESRLSSRMEKLAASS